MADDGVRRHDKTVQCVCVCVCAGRGGWKGQGGNALCCGGCFAASARQLGVDLRRLRVCPTVDAFLGVGARLADPAYRGADF